MHLLKEATAVYSIYARVERTFQINNPAALSTVMFVFFSARRIVEMLYFNGPFL